MSTIRQKILLYECKIGLGLVYDVMNLKQERFVTISNSLNFSKTVSDGLTNAVLVNLL